MTRAMRLLKPTLSCPLTLLALTLACSSQPQTSARDAADADDTGRTLDAKTSSERAILRDLSALPSAKPQHVGDAVVVAEAPYEAASGRTCRALQVTAAGKPSRRLACSDGKAWFFVPEVFGVSAPE